MRGAVGLWLWLPGLPTAGAICSPVLIKMFTLQPLHPPGPGLLGKSVWLRAFLLDPTAAAGPDECAGQARPRVAPPAHQHPCAPAGKATTPGPGPHSVPRVQNQPAEACRDLPSPAPKTQAPSRGSPLPPVGETVGAHRGRRSHKSHPNRENCGLAVRNGLQVQPGVPKQRI